MANVVGTAGTVTSPLTKLSKAEDMQTLEESSIDFYTMLKSVTDQKRQAELQEALNTSALTGEPARSRSECHRACDGTCFLADDACRKRQPATATVEATAPVVSSYTQRGGTVVVIGPPSPAPASPAA